MQFYTTLKNYSFAMLAGAVTLSFSSCNTDEDNDNLEVPATYEFTRDGNSSVSYTGQTERLDQLAIMTSYMKSSNTVGADPLSPDLLKDMFRNENDPYQGQTFEKDLASKCFQNDVTMFEGFMDALATASEATGTASEGVAGVMVEGSSDPTSGYRVDANGVEHIQLIEKGLMGAVFFYQAMEVYLTGDRMGAVGNDDLAEGKNYTNMEHYMDEAFGYFGAPVDFPATLSLDDARFWAKYCNSRNGDLYEGINEELATAFRTARAAIVAKDYEARDQAIQTIMQKWSIVIGSTAVDYLNQSLSTTGIATYKKHHTLSEAIAFMMGLKYHSNGGNAKYPPHYNFSEVQNALDLIGPNTNLYQVTDTEIEEAIGHVRSAFPSGDIK